MSDTGATDPIDLSNNISEIKKEFLSNHPNITHFLSDNVSINNILDNIQHTNQKNYNIVYFVIKEIKVQLHISVALSVLFIDSEGKSFMKRIVLSGDSYTNWGNDDDYLFNYIKDNINTLLD